MFCHFDTLFSERKLSPPTLFIVLFRFRAAVSDEFREREEDTATETRPRRLRRPQNAAFSPVFSLPAAGPLFMRSEHRACVRANRAINNDLYKYSIVIFYCGAKVTSSQRYVNRPRCHRMHALFALLREWRNKKRNENFNETQQRRKNADGISR